MDEAAAETPTPTEGPKRTIVTRGKDSVAKAKVRAEEIRVRAEATRPRSVSLDVAMGSYEHDAAVGGGILAGAVAFRVFLFIVPFVFFLVVALGLAADASGRTTQELVSEAGFAGLVASSINAGGTPSFWGRMSILAVSGFAMLLGARTLVKVLNVVHVLVWRLPRSRVQKPVSAIAGLIFSVAFTLALAHGTSRLGDASLLFWLLGQVVLSAYMFAVWLIASKVLFAHPPEVSWKDFVPGALLVAAGIGGLQLFTVLFLVRSFERRSETFGAIGGSLSLLLWAYVVGRVLTATVVLNSVIWRRTQPEATTTSLLPPPAPPPFPPPG